MDIVRGLIEAVVMLGFIALALGALACMFIIVFSLASGIDRRINE